MNKKPLIYYFNSHLLALIRYIAIHFNYKTLLLAVIVISNIVIYISISINYINTEHSNLYFYK